MIWALITLWIFAALLTTKLDAVWTGQPTYISNFVIALFTWPLGAFFMLITKHPVSEYTEDY